MGMNMSIDINSINTEVYCDAVPDLLFCEHFVGSQKNLNILATIANATVQSLTSK
jgi:hypothetical protein